MGEPRYLIDTNAIIDYLSRKLPATGMDFMSDVIDAVPNVSVVTKIEVLGFNAPAESYQLLSDFMDDSIIMGLVDEVIDVSIELRKKYKIKLPDAIIAATALAWDLTLISRNIADFKNIEGLQFINPYSI